MAVKARGSITITDITDAYSVILSNDAHTFIGNTDSAVAGTASTNVYAFLGAEQLPVTIGEITCPTGMTAKVSNNGTTNALVTFTVTTALKTGGAVNIPVTIVGKDISITKSFAYSIAFTGKTGAKGDTGEAGKGIKSTTITYQKSTSGTAIPTGTWNASIPSVGPGEYLWTKTVIEYTSGDPSTSYSVGMMGATGGKGDKGDTGVGIKSTTVEYQKSTSGTTVPTETWSTTIPAVGASEYLWTRTTMTYTSGSPSVSYSVGMMGATGAKGDRGDTGAAGADAILLGYTASNGVHFKNGSGTTTLTALVYKGGVQQTVNDNGVCGTLGTVKWYKDETLVGTGKQLVVNAEDVDSIAVFEVTLEG